MNIYLTNLAKYNEGRLVGKWVGLPLDEESLQEELDTVLGHDEEYFISDYETPVSGLELHEYTPLEVLNELAETLEGLEDYQLKAAEIMMEGGESWREALAAVASGDFHMIAGEKIEDVGHWMMDTGFIEVPDSLIRYIDFEAVGQDFLHNSTGYYEGQGHFLIRTR